MKLNKETNKMVFGNYLIFIGNKLFLILGLNK